MSDEQSRDPYAYVDKRYEDAIRLIHLGWVPLTVRMQTDRKFKAAFSPQHPASAC